MHLWKLAPSVAPHHITWSIFLQKWCFFSLKRRNSIPGAYNFPLGISLLKDCKDFHQAKDGDGWVEQSSQPFFFGLLQKVCTIIHFGEILFSKFTVSILLPSPSLERKKMWLNSWRAAILYIYRWSCLEWSIIWNWNMILLFKMMYKQVDAPFAYVCADSRIYDATEWYICQVYFHYLTWFLWTYLHFLLNILRVIYLMTKI